MLKILSYFSKMSLQQSVKLFLLFVSILALYQVVISPFLIDKKIEACRDGVIEKYREKWVSYCYLEKREIGEDGLCRLSKERANYVNDQKHEELNQCSARFR